MKLFSSILVAVVPWIFVFPVSAHVTGEHAHLANQKHPQHTVQKKTPAVFVQPKIKVVEVQVVEVDWCTHHPVLTASMVKDLLHYARVYQNAGQAQSYQIATSHGNVIHARVFKNHFGNVCLSN